MLTTCLGSATTGIRGLSEHARNAPCESWNDHARTRRRLAEYECGHSAFRLLGCLGNWRDDSRDIRHRNLDAAAFGATVPEGLLKLSVPRHRGSISAGLLLDVSRDPGHVALCGLHGRPSRSRRSRAAHLRAARFGAMRDGGNHAHRRLLRTTRRDSTERARGRSRRRFFADAVQPARRVHRTRGARLSSA